MKIPKAVTIDQFMQAIKKQASRKEGVVVAISGFGGSGKTTLAQRLANELEGVNVISMDDFIVDRLSVRSEDWEGFDYKRLMKEVLEPIRNNASTIRYHQYDWDQNKLGKLVTVKLSKYVILEGLGILQGDLMKFFNITAWIDVPLQEAIKRGMERDKQTGTENKSSWEEIWQPNDKDFFQKHHPKEHADFIIRP